MGKKFLVVKIEITNLAEGDKNILREDLMEVIEPYQLAVSQEEVIEVSPSERQSWYGGE
jgi:hypothetical protein